MKKATLAVLLLLFVGIANAQFKPVAEGPVFKEPEEGRAKILQMKNGSTMFIVITAKKGIDVQVYNEAHQQIAVTNIEPASIKLKVAELNGIFEIKGDVVLMLTAFESRTPTLHRLIIDGKTGNLKDEQTIAQLNKLGLFAGYAMVWGDVPQPDFFVRKDPASDNYAVAMFNSFESDRSKRIEIVTYGSDNKEVSRAFYASPQEHYKYLRYVDMTVLGSDKVCVLAYGYNTAHSGGKESELILANLDKGATSVSFTELGFSKDMVVYWGLVKYSPAVKSLVLLAIVKGKENDKGYTPILAFVDPFEKKFNSADVIAPSERLNQYSKKGFTGLPQNLYVNNDGTFTVISEEIQSFTNTSSMGTSSTSTTLGDMAVVNYSKTGKFVNDYLIRKSHDLSTYLSPFYMARREGTAQGLYKGNQFKSFAYLDGITKSYVLFNDTERNNEKQEKGSLVTVSGVSQSDGFYYTLSGPDAILKRDYVFGNPAGKRDHILGLFSISDYDRINNLYVTLRLNNESGKKGVQVVWLQP